MSAGLKNKRNTEMSDNIEQQIRERAYEIWNQNGRIEGFAQEHWCEAERQVTAVVTAPATQSVETPKAVKAAKAKRAPAKKARSAKAASAVTMQ
jgi:hypothetical protein